MRCQGIANDLQDHRFFTRHRHHIIEMVTNEVKHPNSCYENASGYSTRQLSVTRNGMQCEKQTDAHALRQHPWQCFIEKIAFLCVNKSYTLRAQRQRKENNQRVVGDGRNDASRDSAQGKQLLHAANYNFYKTAINLGLNFRWFFVSCRTI